MYNAVHFAATYAYQLTFYTFDRESFDFHFRVTYSDNILCRVCWEVFMVFAGSSLSIYFPIVLL